MQLPRMSFRSLPVLSAGRTVVPLATGHMSGAANSLQRDFPEPVLPAPPPPLEEREDSIDSSTLLVSPDTPSESEASITQGSSTDCSSGPSLSTMV